MRTFKDYVEAKEPYPVAQPFSPPPGFQPAGAAKVLTPQHASRIRQAPPLAPDQAWRVRTGKGLTRDEEKVIKWQKQELANYGVVLTPYRPYGSYGSMQDDPNAFNF